MLHCIHNYILIYTGITHTHTHTHMQEVDWFVQEHGNTIWPSFLSLLQLNASNSILEQVSYIIHVNIGLHPICKLVYSHNGSMLTNAWLIHGLDSVQTINGHNQGWSIYGLPIHNIKHP